MNDTDLSYPCSCDLGEMCDHHKNWSTYSAISGNSTIGALAEYTKWAARIKKLETALEEISAELPCEISCLASALHKVCITCGRDDNTNIWCAGCLAREALKP